MVSPRWGERRGSSSVAAAAGRAWQRQRVERGSGSGSRVAAEATGRLCVCKLDGPEVVVGDEVVGDRHGDKGENDGRGWYNG